MRMNQLGSMAMLSLPVVVVVLLDGCAVGGVVRSETRMFVGKGCWIGVGWCDYGVVGFTLPWGRGAGKDLYERFVRDPR